MLEINLESKLKEHQQTKKKLSELIHKIEKLEERFVQREVELPLFQKFSQKYQADKTELEKLLPQTEINSSNLLQIVEKGLKLAGKLSDTWALSKFDDKRKLQSLVFPEGILYNKQKDTVRTPRINSLFAPIPILSTFLKDNKKGHSHKNELKLTFNKLLTIRSSSKQSYLWRRIPCLFAILLFLSIQSYSLY